MAHYDRAPIEELDSLDSAGKLTLAGGILGLATIVYLPQIRNGFNGAKMT